MGKTVTALQSKSVTAHEVNNNIVYNLQRYNLIEGVVFAGIDGARNMPINLEQCMITPTGIEYLSDNSFIHKAESFLKSTKAILPFA